MIGFGWFGAYGQSADALIEFEVASVKPAQPRRGGGGMMVTDATGLKGKYDFTLSWAPERAGPIAVSPDAETVPNLFAAVQQQLGLRLEPKKGQVEILVVDHVEKVPIGN